MYCGQLLGEDTLPMVAHVNQFMANAARCLIRGVDLQQHLGPLPVPDDGMGTFH